LFLSPSIAAEIVEFLFLEERDIDVGSL